ncbi:hypothetical protein [Methylobacterium sp. GC_Met_2]|uniref:hypothetical protein n=1 Tax=Methylobacterium sp. GC_Met_2 TaxID=2937376 RepID=UPI00226B5518|nr:hypothetical protein [Methylobacterium sp. GC_Met_2]
MPALRKGSSPPPNDRDWDARAVEYWLLSPMRRLRDGVDILAAPGNRLMAADSSIASAPFDILAFARTVLGEDTPELKAVITWARIRADGRDIEASIAEWCDAWGWNERTFHLRRKRACEKIAKAKNSVDHENRKRGGDAS